MASMSTLPPWAKEIADLYASHAASQFILSGNVHDRFLVPGTKDNKLEVGSLSDYLQRVLMPRFQVVITYDLGNGIRIERGQEIFAQWPAFKERPELPKTPLAAIETLTRYFCYASNLRRLGKESPQIACIIRSAHLVAPAVQGHTPFDLGAVALLMREWAEEPALTEHPLVTYLIADNLHDLHPLLANNARAPRIEVPMPDAETLARGIDTLGFASSTLGQFANDTAGLARQLTGASFQAVERMLRMAEHTNKPLQPTDLAELKKDMVENDCGGLIEFIQPRLTLDAVAGHADAKQRLEADARAIRRGQLEAAPMGYLICGPVGTGKSFIAECYAGSVGIPCVVLKNFRSKYVGETEGNLEHALGVLRSLGPVVVVIGVVVGGRKKLQQGV
jgi:hypothetical protein